MFLMNCIPKQWAHIAVSPFFWKGFCSPIAGSTSQKYSSSIRRWTYINCVSVRQGKKQNEVLCMWEKERQGSVLLTTGVRDMTKGCPCHFCFVILIQMKVKSSGLVQWERLISYIQKNASMQPFFLVQRNETSGSVLKQEVVCTLHWRNADESLTKICLFKRHLSSSWFTTIRFLDQTVFCQVWVEEMWKDLVLSSTCF